MTRQSRTTDIEHSNATDLLITATVELGERAMSTLKRRAPSIWDTR